MLNTRRIIENSLILLCLSLVGFIVFECLSSRIPRPESRNGAVGAVRTIERDSGLGTPKPSVVYRKSLIPGGVSDAAALRTAVLRDPVLVAAFQNFDWNAAAPCVVPEGEFFVSYRVADQIRWTTLPGSLAGQGCITDGHQTVLTRCGNLISFVPQSPAGTETPGSLSLPEPTAAYIPARAPETILSYVPQSAGTVPPAVVENSPTPIVPIGFIPIILVPPATTTPPTVQVPEPSISILIGIGLFFMICLRLVQARRISK